MEREIVPVDNFVDIYMAAVKHGLCVSQKDFAEKFGLNKNTVCNILNGNEKYLTPKSFNKWKSAFDAALTPQEETIEENVSTNKDETIARLSATVASQQDTIAELIKKYVLV